MAATIGFLPLCLKRRLAALSPVGVFSARSRKGCCQNWQKDMAGKTPAIDPTQAASVSLQQAWESNPLFEDQVLWMTSIMHFEAVANHRRNQPLVLEGTNQPLVSLLGCPCTLFCWCLQGHPRNQPLVVQRSPLFAGFIHPY